MQILNLELGRHWWFNCRAPLLDVELESTVYRVRLGRLPLYSFDSTQPLGCIGSSVVEHLPSKKYVCCGFESHLSSSVFLTTEKELFRLISCIAFFTYVG